MDSYGPMMCRHDSFLHYGFVSVGWGSDDAVKEDFVDLPGMDFWNAVVKHAGDDEAKLEHLRRLRETMSLVGMDPSETSLRLSRHTYAGSWDGAAAWCRLAAASPAEFAAAGGGELGELGGDTAESRRAALGNAWAVAFELMREDPAFVQDVDEDEDEGKGAGEGKSDAAAGEKTPGEEGADADADAEKKKKKYRRSKTWMSPKTKRSFCHLFTAVMNRLRVHPPIAVDTMWAIANSPTREEGPAAGEAAARLLLASEVRALRGLSENLARRLQILKPCTAAPRGARGNDPSAFDTREIPTDAVKPLPLDW
jgi:hypothetical protein